MKYDVVKDTLLLARGAKTYVNVENGMMGVALRPRGVTLDSDIVILGMCWLTCITYMYMYRL